MEEGDVVGSNEIWEGDELSVVWSKVKSEILDGQIPCQILDTRKEAAATKRVQRPNQAILSHF